ncbi:MAG: hypothetical protein F9B45_12525 [Phycisphaera sp. RhM]|nr:hypothetical protein [Phycisphaera sp. RhM]
MLDFLQSQLDETMVAVDRNLADRRQEVIELLSGEGRHNNDLPENQIHLGRLELPGLSRDSADLLELLVVLRVSRIARLIKHQVHANESQAIKLAQQCDTVEFQQEAAAAANEASDFDITLHSMLRLGGKSTRWPVGKNHLY